MDERDKAIRELHAKLVELSRQQQTFQDQIQKIQRDLMELETGINTKAKYESTAAPIQKKTVQDTPIIIKAPATSGTSFRKEKEAPRGTGQNKRTPIEEFIGSNLLNKVGIAVLVIGLGFGAKYSIDHALLDPVTRITLGYIAGIILVGLALRLKKRHDKFSAVLVSGGMAVMYFMTYAAHDFYSIIPQTVSFLPMVVLTAATVFAATWYNKEVIGIIGLTGAYAVPFLLSDGSGRVAILFSYITIINTGILILAFKKYWKVLYYVAFILTWLSFASWHLIQFDEQQHVWVSLGFSTIFFVIFYITFLSYKLLRSESLGVQDLALMLANSFIYFAYGYITIDSAQGGDRFLGAFAVFTAFIHFIACIVISARQTSSRDTFYFVTGMGLVFLTIAIPIQLEGHWVTLIWAAESAVLFWIGRVKRYPVHEKISYALMLLMILSLFHDWGNTYREAEFFISNPTPELKLFLNIQFLTTVFVIAVLCFAWSTRNKSGIQSALPKDTEGALQYGLPLVMLFILYMGIFKEIDTFWNQRYADAVIPANAPEQYLVDNDLLSFKKIWLLIYSGIFCLALAACQIFWLKTKPLMMLSTVLNTIFIFSFLTIGLMALSELRESYVNDFHNAYFYRGVWHIGIRYVSIIPVIILMWINFNFLKNEIYSAALRQTERILLSVAILVLLSSELIHWLAIMGVVNTFKLSLSLLWGGYALLLIVLGLFKERSYIRITGIILFTVTLIKLFFYDMRDMSTISKTIVMVILGVLLLTASFLYNKYKSAAGTDAQQ